MFTEKIATITHTDKWKKRDWVTRREELLSSTYRSLKVDLEHRHGVIFAFEPKLLAEKEKEQTYGNSPLRDEIVELTIEATFIYREYSGPTEGTVSVHKRIILKEMLDLAIAIDPGMVYNRFIEEGYAFIKTFLPQATHRVGCNCCYGDGPDLECKIETRPNGDLHFIYTVNFDFRYE